MKVTRCPCYSLQKGTVSLWKNTFATPSIYFLIYRTGFLVISRYSQNQICDIGSLFHSHTTYCQTKRYV